MEKRVSSLETRVDAVERQNEKTDASLQRMWERMDQHRDAQVRTQTLVEEVGKDVTEVRLQITKLADAQNESRQAASGKWEEFFGKGFWLVVGAVIAVAAAQYK